MVKARTLFRDVLALVVLYILILSADHWDLSACGTSNLVAVVAAGTGSFVIKSFA